MKSFYICLLMFIIFMLASCRTQYIPVESVRYDSIYFAKLQKDSIYIQDSTYIKEKGDTVFIDKFKYIYKYINLQDTCYIEKKDSILIPYPIERKLTWWKQKKLDFGSWFIGIVVIYLAYRLIGWLIKKTRKE